MAGTNKEPVHMTLTNLTTNEILVLPFNPPTLSHSKAVNWSRSQILGQTFEDLHYVNTGNHQLPIQFFFDVDGPKTLATYADARRYIESGLHPVSSDRQLKSYGAPPTFLVVWPKTLSLTMKMANARFNDQHFRTDGQVVTFTIDVLFEEHNTVRRSSEYIRTNGLLRGGDFV